MSSDNDHYYAESDHTAIPDWLALCADLSIEARMVVLSTLVLQKRGRQPTRVQLATLLGVDTRSIYRWLAELDAAGAIVRRRGAIVFTNPQPDRTISDRTITDSAITDSAIRLARPAESRRIPQQRHKPAQRDRGVTDRAVGVGVGHDSLQESDPTPTNRAPLKTDLARWMKRAGMNAAREFDDPALDYWTYRRFVEDKRGMGWEWRQIVSTLREAPIERDPMAPPAAEREALEAARAEDLDLLEAAREIAEGVVDPEYVDSTVAALTRRFEADRAEAAARAAGAGEAWSKVL